MTDYHVTWEIDICAETPEEAAQQALEIQRRPTGWATVFMVNDGKTETRVDLDDDL